MAALWIYARLALVSTASDYELSQTTFNEFPFFSTEKAGTTVSVRGVAQGLKNTFFFLTSLENCMDGHGVGGDLISEVSQRF